MPRLHRQLRLALVPSLLTAACAAPPAAEPPPPLALASAHFPGSVRTGPLAPDGLEGSALADDETPWEAALDVRYVEVLSRAHGVPLERLARRVVVDDASEPLRLLADLALGLRFAFEPPPDAAELWSDTQRGVLWPGVTASFQAGRERFAGAPGAAWDKFQVDVSRRAALGEPLELALVLTGEVAVRRERAAEGDAADAVAPRVERPRAPRTEHVVLDPGRVIAGETLYLLLPAPARATPEGGFVLALRVDPLAAPAEALVATARIQVRAAASHARERVGRLGTNEGFRRESGRALHALEVERLQRPALVFLSRTADAPLLADLALAASDDELARFTADVGAEIAAAGEELDPAAYQWLLERGAWRWAAARTSDEVKDPPAELRALLLRHAGEAGRYPDLVLDAVAECASVAELRERIEHENTIFLEEGNPAARVRAFDWLDERRLAPAGYDPLASRGARRAALAALDAEDEPDAEDPAPGARGAEGAR